MGKPVTIHHSITISTITLGRSQPSLKPIFYRDQTAVTHHIRR